MPYVKWRITGYITKQDYAEWDRIDDAHGGMSEDDFQAWYDRKMAMKRALYRPKSTTTPKWLRPHCGAKTRVGGSCCATPVWDKKHNRPANGRCRMHGGLSTGPRSAEGKLKALRNLKQFRKQD